MQTSYSTDITLMLKRWVPAIFWAVLVSHCRVVMSCVVHKPCKVVIFPVRMLFIALLYKSTRIWLQNSLLKFPEEVEVLVAF